MPETALVTGACGFVGRHVARQLSAAGYVVSGIGHGDWAGQDPAAWGISQWRATDVDGKGLAEHGGRPSLIVHCAGSGSVPFSLEFPREDLCRTVNATLEVLDYVRLHVPEAAVVFPSSAAVYGRVDGMPITTDAPLNPLSPYGAHKKMAEDLCRSYATHFGVRVALVRLFSVYGLGLRKQLLWDACRKIDEARRTASAAQFSGDGNETRDWINVNDAATLLVIAASAASTKCPVLNGASGVGIKVRAVVNRLAAGLTAPTPIFSGVPRPGDPRHFQADITEATALGWTPVAALEDELDAYVSWFASGDANPVPHVVAGSGQVKRK